MEEEANVAAQDLSIAPKYASPPTTCYLVGGSCLNINNHVAPWEYNFVVSLQIVWPTTTMWPKGEAR
jgi:hypothetical protein